MKNVLTIVAWVFMFSSSFGQESCEVIYENCLNLMNVDPNDNFISDGQSYVAFLDQEKAEFNATLYGETTYRIVASSGEKENYVIFNITDPDGNLLFSNANYANARRWDFQIPATIPVKIEAELDADFKSTGCVVLMIGFQKP